MKILFLGDIVGKPGRKAIAKVLPEWKKEHDPDLVIANGENMAHGSGFTLVGFEEVQKAGVDFFTSGNHWPRKEEGMLLFSGKKYPIIRPGNWVGAVSRFAENGELDQMGTGREPSCTGDTSQFDGTG